MHLVYILYSDLVGKYYVGQTADMENRMLWHNELGSGYTSKHRPWVLKKAYQVSSLSMALKVERYIKKKKSRAFIEKLIIDDGLWEYALTKCSAD